MTEPAPLRTTTPATYFITEDTGSKSTLISRNITILGRRTSVRLEPEMWNALKDISRREGCSMHDICSLIHIRKNVRTSLTGAIRVFLMLYYRAASTEDGHARAGHGSFETMKRRAQLTKDLHEYQPASARPDEEWQISLRRLLREQPFIEWQQKTLRSRRDPWRGISADGV